MKIEAVLYVILYLLKHLRSRIILITSQNTIKNY